MLDIGENHARHQQFSRNPQIFHVRCDFLLGLPTITSIFRRISVVRLLNNCMCTAQSLYDMSEV